MTRSSGIAWTVVLLTWTVSVMASPFDLDGADWEGLSDFVALARVDLGNAKVVSSQTLDFDDLRPEDAVLIFHPQIPLDADALASFMRRGGRVVLLDDFGTGDGLLHHFGLERVPAPAHPIERLRGNPNLPIAEPAGNHPVSQNLSRVVTNHPTGVRHPDLSPVLKIRGAEGDVLVAQAGAVGLGRFLAVGDPSMVINAMLRYPGNRAFARALIRYGTEDDTWGRRHGRLVLVSNGFRQTGSSATAAPLHEWQQAFRDALEAVRREGFSSGVAHVFAACVGLGVIVWVGGRAVKTHYPSPPRFVCPTPVVAQGGVAGHAAVIGAPGTAPVLAMLELKSALVEELCELLSLDGVLGAEELLDHVARTGLLDLDGQRGLRDLLLRFARAETLMLAHRQVALSRVGDRDVRKAAELTFALVAQAQNHAQVNVKAKANAS